MLISPTGQIKYSDFGLARLICGPRGQMTKNVCTMYSTDLSPWG